MEEIIEEGRGLAEDVNDTINSPEKEASSKRRRKRNQQKRKRKSDDDEEDTDSISSDDCKVASDGDCDEITYADEGARDEDDSLLGVDLVYCSDLETEFGAIAREEENVSDADSGDDIWDEEKISDPFSDSENEDMEERDHTRSLEEEEEDLLSLGKTFSTLDDFKLVVLRYSLKTRYDIKLYRSQRLKIGAKCNDEKKECKWRCYCAYDKKKHKMQVKVFRNFHSCARSGYSKMLKEGTITWLFGDRLRKNPKITKQEMVAEIQREYNLCVSEGQCSKAKTRIMKENKASHEDHFSRVWDYQAEIWRSNPRTIFEIETIPGPTIGSLQRFFRLFICFKSQKDSWMKHCRPIIGIDGAFLKWDIKGHLLAATGRDGDNRIVPIAWAVVEIENDDNWDWFIKMLVVTLKIEDGGRKLALISDKQAGLVKAIHNVLPEAEHRQCAKHIMDNWKRNSHDMELQRLFWKIARSYTTGEYATHMEALRSYNPGAYASLLTTQPLTWSRAFFRIGTFCNDNLNNLSESFNRTIRLARRKPLLDMLEDIRRQCMVRNEKRYIISGRLQTKFTKRAHVEIEKMIADAQFCVRWMARNNKHEIQIGNDQYCVDMNDNSCGCRKWQMTGIPCIHVASVIIGKKEKVDDYVLGDWYTCNKWHKTYEDGIEPVQGPKMWPRTNKLPVLPPPWRRGTPGRPSNYARRKSRYETTSNTNKDTLPRHNRMMTCSNCKQEDHNCSTCTNPRVDAPPKKSRGRPKKTQEPRNVLFGQGNQENYSQGQPSQPQGTQRRPSQPRPSQASHSRQPSQPHSSQGQGKPHSSERQSSQPHSSQGQASQHGLTDDFASWF